MRVSVVIPALNEAATVGQVVQRCRASNAVLCGGEVLVIDSDSTDGTATIAARAGARVVNWREVSPLEPQEGKGEALWRGVKAARGAHVVFVDADVTSLHPWWIDALAKPLQNPEVHLVKARYVRALHGNPTGGGRVTELTAKPLLRRFFPDLGDISQPLSGEYAIRRDTALQLPFVAGYGVESGLLIDTYARYGRTAIAEVDLGSRVHRNRPMAELGPMAEVVASTIIDRALALGQADSGLKTVQRPPWCEIPRAER
ncbi:glucosyl-3-phosphoglycerate synthase [Corynebacterium sp. NML140438]|uniref:glucosyl-3-phosphoglycerate synthase n=1 Tax=Corynebacterium sp. NML140438 TaxID=1906334 RepID=UPI0008FB2FEF|nr:glucosyl-3-phosphoglycerate synthase [Corynebacterium sp. NML140438]OIR41599.1 glucosyl-3-phosphoglycerate synthase [Corynebacterium sp. NML140438]